MRWAFLQSDRFWKWVLWVGVGFFLLSRLLTLTSFPIFNDESLYLQYSQLIHEDFGRHKLVSAGLNIYRDWKPPFQYWFGSFFMGLADDPMIAGRLAALCISIFGLWGVYLLVKELFGRREASLAIFLYALCPPALFFNIQFIAETFVFSLAPWLYWCLLKTIQPDRIRLQYAAAASAFGGLLLLSKQSGLVYLLLALLLPLTILDFPAWKKKTGEKINWRGWLSRFGVVVGCIVVALLLRRAGLSAEAAQLESRFNSGWLLGFREILGLPFGIWKTNLGSVGNYYLAYYSAFIALPLLYFFFIILRRRHFKNIVLGLGFLGGSATVILLLRSFHEYIYNTAVIVFLVPILTAAFFQALDAVAKPRADKASHATRRAGALVLISFAGLIINWTYQDVLMRASAADYIRQSTPWAEASYLNNWSGGFGVAEAIQYVKEQEEPVLVLADPQWGNPRTALEVYNWGNSNVRVIGLTKDFQTDQGTKDAKKYILEQPFKTRLVVFSMARNEARAVWQDNVLKNLCDNRKEVQVEPEQPPIFICIF